MSKHRQSKWDIQDDSKDSNNNVTTQLSLDATLSQSQNQRFYDGNQTMDNGIQNENRITPKSSRSFSLDSTIAGSKSPLAIVNLKTTTKGKTKVTANTITTVTTPTKVRKILRSNKSKTPSVNNDNSTPNEISAIKTSIEHVPTLPTVSPEDPRRLLNVPLNDFFVTTAKRASASKPPDVHFYAQLTEVGTFIYAHKDMVIANKSSQFNSNDVLLQLQFDDNEFGKIYYSKFTNTSKLFHVSIDDSYYHKQPVLGNNSDHPYKWSWEKFECIANTVYCTMLLRLNLQFRKACGEKGLYYQLRGLCREIVKQYWKDISVDNDYYKTDNYYDALHPPPPALLTKDYVLVCAVNVDNLGNKACYRDIQELRLLMLYPIGGTSFPDKNTIKNNKYIKIPSWYNRNPHIGPEMYYGQTLIQKRLDAELQQKQLLQRSLQSTPLSTDTTTGIGISTITSNNNSSKTVTPKNQNGSATALNFDDFLGSVYQMPTTTRAIDNQSVFMGAPTIIIPGISSQLSNVNQNANAIDSQLERILCESTSHGECRFTQKHLPIVDEIRRGIRKWVSREPIYCAIESYMRNHKVIDYRLNKYYYSFMHLNDTHFIGDPIRYIKGYNLRNNYTDLAFFSPVDPWYQVFECIAGLQCYLAFLIDQYLDYRMQYHKTQKLTIEKAEKDGIDTLWTISNANTLKERWVPDEALFITGFDLVSFWHECARMNQNTPDASLLKTMAIEPNIKITDTTTEHAVFKKVNELQQKYPKWQPAPWLTMIMNKNKQKGRSPSTRQPFRNSFIKTFGGEIFNAYSQKNHTLLSGHNWVAIHMIVSLTFDIFATNLTVLMKYDYQKMAKHLMDAGRPEQQCTLIQQTPRMTQHYNNESQIIAAVHAPRTYPKGHELAKSIYFPQISLKTLTFHEEYWELNSSKWLDFDRQHLQYQKQSMARTFTEIYEATSREVQEQLIDHSINKIQRIATRRVEQEQSQTPFSYEEKIDDDDSHICTTIAQQQLFKDSINDEQYMKEVETLTEALHGKYLKYYQQFCKDYKIQSNCFKVKFVGIETSVLSVKANNTDVDTKIQALYRVVDALEYVYDLEDMVLRADLSKLSSNELVFQVDFSRISYFVLLWIHYAQCRIVQPDITVLKMQKVYHRSQVRHNGCDEEWCYEANGGDDMYVQWKVKSKPSDNGSGRKVIIQERKPHQLEELDEDSLDSDDRGAGISIRNIGAASTLSLPERPWTAKDDVFFYTWKNGQKQPSYVKNFSSQAYNDKAPGEVCDKIEDITNRNIYLLIIGKNKDNSNGKKWDSHETAEEIIKKFQLQFRRNRLDVQPPYTYDNLYPNWHRISGLIDNGIVISFNIVKGYRWMAKRFLKFVCDNRLIYQKYEKFTFYELFQILRETSLAPKVLMSFPKIKSIMKMYQAIYSGQPKLTEKQASQWVELNPTKYGVNEIFEPKSNAPKLPSLETPTIPTLPVNPSHPPHRTLQQQQLQQLQQQVLQQQQLRQQLHQQYQQQHQQLQQQMILNPANMPNLTQPSPFGNMIPFGNVYPNNPSLPMTAPFIGVNNNLTAYPYAMTPTVSRMTQPSFSTPTVPPPSSALGISMVTTPTAPVTTQLSIPTLTDQEHVVKKQRIIKQENAIPPPPSVQNKSKSSGKRFTVHLCQRANDKQQSEDETNEFATHF